jgi:hypothetical protein
MEKAACGKTKEGKVLTAEYNTLKDETYNIEKIRASVKAILHNDTKHEQQPQRRRAQGIEL